MLNDLFLVLLSESSSDELVHTGRGDWHSTATRGKYRLIDERIIEQTKDTFLTIKIRTWRFDNIVAERLHARHTLANSRDRWLCFRSVFWGLARVCVSWCTCGMRFCVYKVHFLPL